MGLAGQILPLHSFLSVYHTIIRSNGQYHFRMKGYITILKLFGSITKSFAFKGKSFIFKDYVSGLNQFHTIKANCFLKYSLATKFSTFLVHFLFLATNVLSFINENVLLICGLSYGKIFVLRFAKNILHRKSYYPILKILCFACSISYILMILY